MRDVTIGQTDYTVLVKIVSTTGAPVTGLAHTDIDIAYTRVETDNDVTTADVAPANLSALTDAHSDWGWEEVSSGDHPGLYRLDIADAVFASGAWEAVVTITDASGTDFYAVDIGFRLVAWNPLDAVRMGMTALPNAAADGAGGLPISDAGGLDLDAKLANTNEITTARMGALTDWIDGGRLDLILDARASQASVDTVATYIDTEVAAVLAAVDTEVAAILADTNELQTDWADGGRLDLIIDTIAADLPQRITKNTALAGFTFLMVDSADHVTGKTGLTVTATRSLDGAAFGACANAVSEIANGAYKIDLAAADLNANVVMLKFTATGADARFITIVTEPT